MIPQFNNQVMSSFMLYLDNRIITKGQALQNVGTNFYVTTTPVNGYYTYSAPYKQIIADQSVGGQMFTGVYLNGNYIRTGVSGLVSINYDDGQLYFSSALPTSSTLSGNYSIKDFNIYLTDRPEEELLFESKFTPRPKTPQTMSGLANDQLTFPCIFLKRLGTQNEPYELGGNELTTINVQAVVFSDSQFKSDALAGICTDLIRTNVPLLNSNEWPFDNLGNYRSGLMYNYTGLVANKRPTPDTIFINDVSTSRFNYQVNKEFTQINPSVYPFIIEFELVKMRQPRA